MNCWGTACNKHYPPHEVTVNTMLPLRRGERAHGHVQPWYPGKYSGQILLLWAMSMLVPQAHAASPAREGRTRERHLSPSAPLRPGWRYSAVARKTHGEQ